MSNSGFKKAMTQDVFRLDSNSVFPFARFFAFWLVLATVFIATVLLVTPLLTHPEDRWLVASAIIAWLVCRRLYRWMAQFIDTGDSPSGSTGPAPQPPSSPTNPTPPSPASPPPDPPRPQPPDNPFDTPTSRTGRKVYKLD